MRAPSVRLRPWVVPAVVSLALAACAGRRPPPAAPTATRATPAPASSGSSPTPAATLHARTDLPDCAARAPAPAASSAHAAPAAPTALQTAARRGAQRGLGFVAHEAISWQTEHNCYGCHVQAVTLEALSVGRHNQYDVPQGDLSRVVYGLTEINGGSRGSHGLTVNNQPNYLEETSKEFGGAAFARYDAWVGADLTDDLLNVAGQITEYQNDDGSLRTTDTRFPVVAGLMQSTTQAVQTWRQAFARTADERWLAPMQRAEGYLTTRARQLTDDPAARVVDMNYALIGLNAAGAQGAEGAVRSLDARLRELQHQDGGWSFDAGGESNAFATGQTLYALRLMGAADQDPVVERGTAWLVEHQNEDGGWSHTGSGKAEAMWAVLGLVSVDVLSVAVTGVSDGQHVQGTVTVGAAARDNSGAAVRQVDLFVDDVPLGRACGAEFSQAVDVSGLSSGMHSVDLVATNARGQVSRRRVSVYAGDYYLTQLGSRFESGTTHFTLRNVAPPDATGAVRMRVFAARDGQQGGRGDEVFSAEQPGAQGAMRFDWAGAGRDGRALPRGRYVAEFAFVAQGGRVVQSVELPFVHDTDDAQDANFGEVAGTLTANGAGAAANAQVELLDEHGNVVASTMTTEQGNYRFRGLNQGRYRVRVNRAGFRTAEADVVATTPAAAAASPVGPSGQSAGSGAGAVMPARARAQHHSAPPAANIDLHLE